MMKLRNKATGEIREIKEILIDGMFNVNSLAELNAVWEDYDGQKEYWCINEFGTPVQITHTRENIYDKSRKEFGNCFDTREEAEKTVEKLKAWKRLKDAGYYFYRDAIEEGTKHKFILRLGCEQEKIMKPVAECKSNYRDLKILFGDEE